MTVKKIAMRNFNGIDWDTIYPATSADLVETSAELQFITQVEKTKLAGIATGANKYVLPTATASVMGGVKTGTNITNSSGTISVADGTTSAKGVVQLSSATNSTSTALAATASAVKSAYDLAASKASTAVATTSANGLMAAADKTKLNGIEAGAQVNTVTSVAGKTGAVTLDKADVGLTNVDDVKQASKTEFDTHATDMVAHVTASERAIWNGKASKAVVTTTANGLMAIADKTKLDGIEAGANKYIHPDTHPASMITGLSPVATGGRYTDLTNLPTLGTVASKNTGTTSGTIPIIGSDNKLDASIIPSIAISDTHVVASQAEMLALDVQIGDIAVRTDLSKSFILKIAGASTLSNWQELLTPNSPVTSVAGKTGAVTLAKADVGLANVDNVKQASKTEFDAHTTNTTVHITASERTTWNAKASTSVVTTSANGLMAAADKTKLNGIEAGAQVNTVTSVAGKTGAVTLVKADVGLTNVDDVKQASKTEFDTHTTNTTVHITTTERTTWNAKASTAVATTSANGLMAAADKTKLNGIEAGAQVNTVTSVAGRTGAVVVAKGDVGLGSVNNYGIATTAEAVAGTSNVKYMTPLRVKEFIESGPSFTKGLTTSSFATDYSTEGYYSQLVSNTTPAALIDPQTGGNLDNTKHYVISAYTGGTGTTTGLVVALEGNGTTFGVHEVFSNGADSNHPLILLVDGVPHIKTSHANNYTLKIKVERFESSARSSLVYAIKRLQAVATTTTTGLMTGADKAKLDAIAAGANKYTLPTATASVLGGVKTGTNITNSSGLISVADGTTSTKGVVQLVDGTSSTSTALAATGNSVKTVNDSLTTHINNKSNPHGVTKAQVGLGNVDNTSDVNKPVSTATQTALNKKANTDNPTFTGSITIGGAKLQWNSTENSLDFIF